MTGVFVPAGTPKPVVDNCRQEFSAIVNLPDIKASLLELGVVGGGGEGDVLVHGLASRLTSPNGEKVIEDAKINKI